ncbi:MAG: site-specific tyrosine recombinase XerD [Chloroflexota bacterium]
MTGSSAPAPLLPTLAQARDAFVVTLAGKSPHTVHTYTTALGRFDLYLQARGLDAARATPPELPGDVLESFYTWCVTTYGRRARGTQATYVAGVRAYFRFLERRGWGPRGTTFEALRAGLREVMGRAPYRTPRVDPALALIVTHVDALPVPPAGSTGREKRAHLEVLRDKALIRTLFCTGMRRAEVVTLNRTDIADGRRDEALITGKGEKERVVFFDAPTLAAIRAYLTARGDAYAPLFLRHDNGRPSLPGPGGARYRLSTQTVWTTVTRYARACGVTASPHAFRHSKASVMLNSGASLSQVQDILGHASPETTKRIYARYERSTLRDAFHAYSVPAQELVDRLDGERGTRTPRPSRAALEPVADGEP